MRVSTAFEAPVTPAGRGRSVTSVGVVVTVRPQRRRVRRVRRGRPAAADPDHRVGHWRHLDLGSSRCWIECELRRLRCRACGVRLEPVPRRGQALCTRATSRLSWPRWASSGRLRRSRACFESVGLRSARSSRVRSPTTSMSAPARATGLRRCRRAQLPPLSPLPDHRRGPRHGSHRLARAGSQQPHLAGLHGSARRRPRVDPGGLDDIIGGYQRAIRRPPPRPGSALDRSRRADSPRHDRSGSARAMERPRTSTRNRAVGSRARLGRS